METHLLLSPNLPFDRMLMVPHWSFIAQYLLIPNLLYLGFIMGIRSKITRSFRYAYTYVVLVIDLVIYLGFLRWWFLDDLGRHLGIANGAQGLRLTKSWTLGFICFECPFVSYLKKTWFIISKFMDEDMNTNILLPHYVFFENAFISSNISFIFLVIIELDYQTQQIASLFHFWKCLLFKQYFIHLFSYHREMDHQTQQRFIPWISSRLCLTWLGFSWSNNNISFKEILK